MLRPSPNPRGREQERSHMTTAKAAANKANATHSRGPRTAAGKARSSRNAVTHGLTAARFLIPGEEVAAFQAMVAAYCDELHAVGVVEHDLVEDIVVHSWRARRVPWMEAGAVRRTIVE